MHRSYMVEVAQDNAETAGVHKDFLDVRSHMLATLLWLCLSCLRLTLQDDANSCGRPFSAHLIVHLSLADIYIYIHTYI